MLELPNYYNPQMSGLVVDMKVLKHLIREKLADVWNVFEKFDFDPSMITTKWFLLWYLESLPIETVFRIWDCLLNEGPKILFRVALTLLSKNRSRFAQCTSFTNVMDLFKIITTEPSVIDCHSFMEDVFTLPGSLSRGELEKLRKLYSKTN